MTQRRYSLAYLTASALAPAQMVTLASELGYHNVGLRLLPNSSGAPQQHLIGNRAAIAETQARMRDTGVGVFDIEIIRIGEHFDSKTWLPLLEVGATLGAHSLLVAGDDAEPARLAANFAHLCELTATFGLYANLEFMPWTAVKCARDALTILDLAGRPQYGGILVDALHFARSATTSADIAALSTQCRHHLHYAQICDAPPGIPNSVDALIHTARQERLLPGEGGIDLAGLFAVLPHDLPVSVEIPNDVRVARLGVREWSRQALAAARAVLDTLPTSG